LARSKAMAAASVSTESTSPSATRTFSAALAPPHRPIIANALKNASPRAARLSGFIMSQFLPGCVLTLRPHGLTLAAASVNILTNLELVKQLVSDERMRMRMGGNSSMG
jgi:hypothetical protein